MGASPCAKRPQLPCLRPWARARLLLPPPPPPLPPQCLLQPATATTATTLDFLQTSFHLGHPPLPQHHLPQAAAPHQTTTAATAATVLHSFRASFAPPFFLFCLAHL